MHTCERGGKVINMKQPSTSSKENAEAAAEPTLPILVSACLLGERCRYDGKAQPCAAVIELAKRHPVVAVCPEQLGGLPTPRTPSEVQTDGRVVDAAGIDRTGAFQTGAREALRIAREHGCKQAILKENSPSCGVNRIYDGSFSGKLVVGNGVTAALLVNAGIEVLADTCLEKLPLLQ